MGADTKIEWCDHTFNPWRGCTKVAAGCANCYADSQAKRNPKTLGIWGDNGTRVVASESMWREPLKWHREAELACKNWPYGGGKNKGKYQRPRVFCASMADVFENWEGQVLTHDGCTMWFCPECNVWRDGAKPEVQIVAPWCYRHTHCKPLTLKDVRRRLFALIDATPHLDWLLLTKRPENIVNMWPETGEGHESGGSQGWIADDSRPNVWLGTSIANQADADRNIPELLKCRDVAPVLFVSAEPLLGPVNVTRIAEEKSLASPGIDGLDWLIAGGESGAHPRPMHPDWARSLRDQCQAAGVPFFFKQWGEWCPFSQIPNAFMDANDLDQYPVDVIDGASLHRIGKKKAGRLLDGREWNQFPKVKEPTR